MYALVNLIVLNTDKVTE